MNNKIAIGLFFGVICAIITGYFTGIQKFYYNSNDLYGVSWEITLDAYLEGMRKNDGGSFLSEYEIRRKYDPSFTLLAIIGGFSVTYLVSDILTRKKVKKNE